VVEEPLGVRDVHADAAVRGGVADRASSGVPWIPTPGADSPSSACRADCPAPAGSASGPGPGRVRRTPPRVRCMSTMLNVPVGVG
jgi:hypothetical protein